MVIDTSIHAKAQIIAYLHDVFDRTLQHCKDQPDYLFEKPIREGKWSTAQNIDHLCSSTFPLAKGMSLPKLAMKASFGTCNREEKNIEQLYEKYSSRLAQGVQAPPQFAPAVIPNDQKEDLLNKFQYAKEKLIKALDKWDEKSLSKYILPHPALGKLTIREFMFFTIFHTEHHLNTIKSLKSN